MTELTNEMELEEKKKKKETSVSIIISFEIRRFRILVGMLHFFFFLNSKKTNSRGIKKFLED